MRRWSEHLARHRRHFQNWSRFFTAHLGQIQISFFTIRLLRTANCGHHPEWFDSPA